MSKTYLSTEPAMHSPTNSTEPSEPIFTPSPAFIYSLLHLPHSHPHPAQSITVYKPIPSPLSHQICVSEMVAQGFNNPGAIPPSASKERPFES